MLAFILFFVFLGLSIAGGVGIYFLAANDVYLAGSEASRQILYDGQASDVMTTVIDGLYNCSDNAALRDWLLQPCPAGERATGNCRDQYRHRQRRFGDLPCQRTPRSFILPTEEPSFSGTELNVTIQCRRALSPAPMNIGCRCG